MSRPLIAVVGPTATGKTALAVGLAERLAPAALVNADSRQLRRGLRVGTCAPTAADLRGVECRLLDLAEPGEPFTAGDWLRVARPCVDSLLAAGSLPIVVGGTGLYVSALVDGFDLPGAAPDPQRRAERTLQAGRDGGLAELVAQLRRRDPDARVDVANPRRVIRALEILDSGVATLAQARRRRPRPAVLLGLDVPPAVARSWIERRTATMFRGGALQDEVLAALQRGVGGAALASSGIGYREALGVVEGSCDVEAAIHLTVQRTVRYARAQRTYFRRDGRIRWLRADLADPSDLAEAATGIVREALAEPGGAALI